MCTRVTAMITCRGIPVASGCTQVPAVRRHVSVSYLLRYNLFLFICVDRYRTFHIRRGKSIVTTTSLLSQHIQITMVRSYIFLFELNTNMYQCNEYQRQRGRCFIFVTMCGIHTQYLSLHITLHCCYRGQMLYFSLDYHEGKSTLHEPSVREALMLPLSHMRAVNVNDVQC